PAPNDHPLADVLSIAVAQPGPDVMPDDVHPAPNVHPSADVQPEVGVQAKPAVRTRDRAELAEAIHRLLVPASRRALGSSHARLGSDRRHGPVLHLRHVARGRRRDGLRVRRCGGLTERRQRGHEGEQRTGGELDFHDFAFSMESRRYACTGSLKPFTFRGSSGVTPHPGPSRSRTAASAYTHMAGAAEQSLAARFTRSPSTV
ncbi:MAG: hypothetical protein ACK56F_28355, partial [bacterium]